MCHTAHSVQTPIGDSGCALIARKANSVCALAHSYRRRLGAYSSMRRKRRKARAPRLATSQSRLSMMPTWRASRFVTRLDRRRHMARSGDLGVPDRYHNPQPVALSVTKAVRCGLLVLVMALLWPWPVAAAPIAVRFAEGVTHGFLHAAHGRRRPHRVGRPSPGCPGRKSREPHGVPLQGRVAVRRDGGVHPATRLCHAELPPGAARAGVRRRHRDLAAASLREVLRKNEVPQGRTGGGDRRRRSSCPPTSTTESSLRWSRTSPREPARPCIWWPLRPSPC